MSFQIPVIEIESEKGTLLLGNRNGFTTPTAAQTLKLTEQCEPQFVDGVVKNTNSPKDKVWASFCNLRI